MTYINLVISILIVSSCHKLCWANFQNSLNNDILYNSMESYKSPKKQILEYEEANHRRSYEKCSMDLLSRFLTVEGINLLISELANWEGSTVQKVISKVAKLHGLQVYNPESRQQNRLKNPEQLDPYEESRLFIEDRGEYTQRINNLLNSVSVPWVQTEQGYEVTPPENLPKALLLIQNESRDVMNRKWVHLEPKTALLDFLKKAKSQTTLDGTTITDPTFNFKMKRLKSRGCITLAMIGPLKSVPYRPLTITIFSSTLQIEWDSPCLPKSVDVLIYAGYIITVGPSTEFIK